MDQQNCITQLMDPSEYDVIKEEVPIEDESKNVCFQVPQYDECRELIKDEINNEYSDPNTSSKPYQCEPCNKQFAFRSQLVIHQRVHSKERPYHCDVCGMQFKHKSSLVDHQRIHSN